MTATAPDTPDIADAAPTFTPLPSARITLPVELVVRTRQEFKQRALQLITDGARELVLDCRGCRYIDSSGLGVLVKITKAVRAVGGYTVLEGADEETLRLLDLVGMRSLFRFAALVLALVASLAGAPAAEAQSPSFASLPDSTAYRICQERGQLAGDHRTADTTITHPAALRLSHGSVVQLRGIHCAPGRGKDVTRTSRAPYSRWWVTDTTVATVGRTTGLVTVKLMPAGMTQRAVDVRVCYPAIYLASLRRYGCRGELSQ